MVNNIKETGPQKLERLGMDAVKWCVELVTQGIVKADPTPGEMFHAYMCNALMAAYDRGRADGERRSAFLVDTRGVAQQVYKLAEDTARYGDVAMEDTPEGHYYRGRIDEAKSIAKAINAVV